MAIKDSSTVMKLIEKSRLLQLSDLEEAKVLSEQNPESHDFLKILFRQKKITRWQAGQLLAGNTSFFLGKYKLVELLGAGGMGRVFRAEHITMNRSVALKIIAKELVTDADAQKRFLNEARAIAALNHPNIVHAYSVDKEGDRYYIVMEFVEGEDLEKTVAKEGALSPERTASYIFQAASALQHAHERGMIHCDIKPANLLLNEMDQIKILDMGLARFHSASEAKGSLANAAALNENLIGTVDYTAPEVAEDSSAVSPQSDIYSLGCVMYFLLTGQIPFPGETIPERIFKHQCEEPVNPQELNAEIPEPLCEICLKMMAKEPENRSQSMQEILEKLELWLRSEAHEEEEELAGDSSISLDFSHLASPGDSKLSRSGSKKSGFFTKSRLSKGTKDSTDSKVNASAGSAEETSHEKEFAADSSGFSFGASGVSADSDTEGSKSKRAPVSDSLPDFSNLDFLGNADSENESEQNESSTLEGLGLLAELTAGNSSVGKTSSSATGESSVNQKNTMDSETSETMAETETDDLKSLKLESTGSSDNSISLESSGDSQISNTEKFNPEEQTMRIEDGDADTIIASSEELSEVCKADTETAKTLKEGVQSTSKTAAKPKIAKAVLLDESSDDAEDEEDFVVLKRTAEVEKKQTHQTSKKAAPAAKTAARKAAAGKSLPSADIFAFSTEKKDASKAKAGGETLSIDSEKAASPKHRKGKAAKTKAENADETSKGPSAFAGLMSKLSGTFGQMAEKFAALSPKQKIIFGSAAGGLCLILLLTVVLLFCMGGDEGKQAAQNLNAAEEIIEEEIVTDDVSEAAEGEEAKDGEAAEGEEAKDGETAEGEGTKDGEAAEGEGTKDGEAAEGEGAKDGETAEGEGAKDGETAEGEGAKDGETAEGEGTKDGEAAEGEEAKDGEAAEGEEAKDGEAAEGEEAKDGEAAVDAEAEAEAKAKAEEEAKAKAEAEAKAKEEAEAKAKAEEEAKAKAEEEAKKKAEEEAKKKAAAEPFKDSALNVDLPELGSEKVELTQISHGGMDVGVSLLGGDMAFQFKSTAKKPGTQTKFFELEEDEGDVPTWKIKYRAKDKEAVAAILTLEENSLNFEWQEAEDAPEKDLPVLGNCVLKLECNEQSHILALRNPIELETLVLDKKASASVKGGKLEVPLPAVDSLYVELVRIGQIPEDSKDVELPEPMKASDLSPKNPMLIKFTFKDSDGNAQSPMGFTFTPSFGGGGFNARLEAVVITPEGQTMPAVQLPAQVQQASDPQIDIQISKWQKEIASIEKKNEEVAAHARKAEDTLKMAQLQSQIWFVGIAKQLANADFEYRVFAEFDGEQIDFITSRLISPEEKKAKSSKKSKKKSKGKGEDEEEEEEEEESNDTGGFNF